MPERKSHFRFDIQILRAIAVILVILFHSKVPGFEGGFVGVDIFFVVSGFWMASIVINEINLGKFLLRNFYERRMRRILPALYFVLFITYIISWFLLWPRDFDTMSEVLGSSILFLANAVIKNQASSYFSPEMDLHPLLHIWSLSLEEQYYLIFPFIAIFLHKIRKDIALVIGALIMLSSFVAAEMIINSKPTVAFYHLPSRIWEFGLGYLAAYWNIFSKNIVSFRYIYIPSFLILFISIGLLDSFSSVPGLDALIPCVSTALILAYRPANKSSQLRRYLSPLIWIGGISYSLYLVHQPILAFMRIMGYEESIYLVVAILFIGIPISFFIKIFIEDFFRDKSKLSLYAFMKFVFVSSILLVFLSIVAINTNGLPQRFSGIEKQITETAVGNPKRKWCHDNEVNDACIHILNVEPTVAVLGDSHADVLAYAIGENLKKDNSSVLHLSVSGCGFFDKRQRCNNWYKEALNRIINSGNLKTVVVSSRVAGQLHGNHKNIWPELPNLTSLEHQQKVFDAYKEVFNQLINAGKKVIWVLQVPELGPKLEILMREAYNKNGWAVSVSRNWWDKRIKSAKKLSQEINKKVIVYDPVNIFCNDVECHAIKEGTTYYRDRDHMSLSAARIIAEDIRVLLDY